MKVLSFDVEIVNAFTGFATIVRDGDNTVAELVPGGVDAERPLSQQHGYETEAAALSAATKTIQRSEKLQV